MKRFASIWALIALALGAGFFSSGCNAGPRRGLESEFGADRAMRLVEAQRLAERAERTDDYEEQERLLRDAVSLFPQYSPYWTNLGTALAHQNDYGGAGEAFSMAANLDPSDPRPSYNHGLLYLKRGWPSLALEHFERALDRDPRYLNALRGCIQTRKLLREFDVTMSDLLDQAVLVETDEDWLRYFRRQRVLVRGELGLDLNPDDVNRGTGTP